MNTEQDKRENGKRVYKKPMLRTIELAAEEVLAVGCKIASGGGPITACVIVDQCFASGS